MGKQQAHIGVIGLAVMGSNLARNLASREDVTVSVFNRSPERTRKLIADHPEAHFFASETIDDFVASLAEPKTAIIMVQAGAATDAVIESLAERFSAGDIIVDGGNALFTDTIRREGALKKLGINFVGVGISGGEEGALNGPSMMAGGSEEAYESLGPILRKIAAVVDGEPCVTHVGSDGAGHFVKMIHNGIEYADMQLIAESFDVLHKIGGLSPQEISDVFDNWNKGELESYLIEITAEVLRHTDAETSQPFVSIVRDEAGSKGTGVWTVQNALTLGVPVTGIAEAVFARAISSGVEQRKAARSLPGPKPTPVTDADEKKTLIEDVRRALFAAKIVAYAQGFEAIRAGAHEFSWTINAGNVAKIWRGGCIIRAQFLGRIAEAYDKNPNLVTLLSEPFFVKALAEAQHSWRKTVVHAVSDGVPAPAFTSSLAYYDAVRAERLPAALIQAQRDFFGAHSYHRTDKEGVFHTQWSGDKTEIRVEQ